MGMGVTLKRSGAFGSQKTEMRWFASPHLSVPVHVCDALPQRSQVLLPLEHSEELRDGAVPRPGLLDTRTKLRVAAHRAFLEDRLAVESWARRELRGPQPLAADEGLPGRARKRPN